MKGILSIIIFALLVSIPIYILMEYGQDKDNPIVESGRAISLIISSLVFIIIIVLLRALWNYDIWDPGSIVLTVLLCLFNLIIFAFSL